MGFPTNSPSGFRLSLYLYGVAFSPLGASPRGRSSKSPSGRRLSGRPYHWGSFSLVYLFRTTVSEVTLRLQVVSVLVWRGPLTSGSLLVRTSLEGAFHLQVVRVLHDWCSFSARGFFSWFSDKVSLRFEVVPVLVWRCLLALRCLTARTIFKVPFRSKVVRSS